MAQKRYGPTNDAGVVIIEKESEKQILASALGSTAYSGILERGEIGALITTTSKRDLLAKTGGFVPESLLPNAAQDFWKYSGGAGVLFLVRATDGNEVKASLTLFDRKLPRNQVLRVDAKNGGGWGGRQTERVMDLDAVPGDITAETTVKLPDLFVVAKDQYKNGTVKFSETGTSYEIVSHTVGDGITGAVVTVKADATMLADYGAGTDVEIILAKSQLDGYGRERRLAVVVRDGPINPTTEWSMDVYLNDDYVKSYNDMSSDPDASNYYAKLINEDLGNQWISVTDLWVGGITAAVRPANDYGVIPAAGIAAKSLTLAKVAVDLSAANASTIGTFTFGADVVPDTYTLTRDATDWAVTSVKQALHVVANVADAGTHVAENSLGIGFTLGGTPANGDVITIEVLTLRPSDAVGGLVYPDVDNAPNTGFRISANTEEAVTIVTGDLTADGAAADNYRLEYQQELEGGYDGIAAITTQAYLDIYDVPTSKFNDTLPGGYGLIKHATPGIELLTEGTIDPDLIQQAGDAYCIAKNHQFRYEIDPTITDEATAKDHVNNTLGRSDHVKVCFPSYADISDPVKPNLLKEVSMTGKVHGWEARIAANYGGYHKAAAGIDVSFSDVKDIPTGETVLNGEILNPVGIQRIIKKNGRFILWGGRIPSIDPAFRFANHREQLSYYEHVLAGSFDYIIFAINDKQEQSGLISALKSFFIPEWEKRALRGDTFEEAAIIKVDDENNTDATRAAGDLNADISLQLADMVERLNLTVNKQGVFEATAA